jgi:hypothetical protein
VKATERSTGPRKMPITPKAESPPRMPRNTTTKGIGARPLIEDAALSNLTTSTPPSDAAP